jgi:hypothetical protein
MSKQTIESCQIIEGHSYNISFNYKSELKDYLNANYDGIYKCVELKTYTYENIGFMSIDFMDEDYKNDTIYVIAMMRNTKTNRIIEMKIYTDFYSICIDLVPDIQKLLIGGYQYESANIYIYPTVREYSELIFKILIAEQQMEHNVSPNVKQVIQNNDLNRYLMGFI